MGASPLHVLKGPRVPETSGHPFLCEHFRGTLMGGECLRRQTTRAKAPAQAKDRAGRVPPHLAYCASGECDQGAEIAKKFPDWKPDERPRPDWAAQMQAKRRGRVLPDEQPKREPTPVPDALPTQGMEEARMGEKTCSESGCDRPARTKGLCGKHYQRSRKGATQRLGKAAPQALHGQDEFDLMISIRDQFRKLSPDGRRYVLAALTGGQ